MAGKFNRDGGQLLQRTIETLRAHGHRVTPIPTNGPGHATSIARECVARGAGAVVVAGGDGTVNEVANGLVGSDVPLAVLPGGTANVMAVETGIGTNIIRAAERVGDWEVQRISVGKLTSRSQDRCFLLMAGAGLDAMIVYRIDASLKRRIGKAAYWLGGFSQLGRALPEFHARGNGSESVCSFALASRVKNYGGDLTIARGASLFSDQFEVVLFEGAHSLPYMKYFLGVLTNRLHDMQGVRVIRTESLTLDAPGGAGIYVQVDGEFAGSLPAQLTIVPRALNMLFPREFIKAHRG